MANIPQRKPALGNGLARLLKPFGISSKLIRFDDSPARGYEKESFKDAFTRYLAVTDVTTLKGNDLQGNTDVTRDNHVTSKNSRKPLGNNHVTSVTANNRGADTKEDFLTEKPPF